MTMAAPANVRTGPGRDYAVRVVLAEGVTVRVTGAVRDRDWLRVDLRGDGSEAFIYAPLLKAAAFSAPLQPLGSDWSITENQPCQVWNGGMGDKYKRFTWSGNCVNGKASGKGRLVWRSRLGKHVYEGFVLAGKRHGSGTLRRSDGSRYVGEWRSGQRHGSGTYTWAVGHRYKGTWSDDKPHGFGTATFADGDVPPGAVAHGLLRGAGRHLVRPDRHRGSLRLRLAGLQHPKPGRRLPNGSLGTANPAMTACKGYPGRRLDAGAAERGGAAGISGSGLLRAHPRHERGGSRALPG